MVHWWCARLQSLICQPKRHPGKVFAGVSGSASAHIHHGPNMGPILNMRESI